MNNEKEIWRIYPEFEWIQGSNLGRVRTINRYVKRGNCKQFVRGQILNQFNKNGYLRVHFNANGRYVNRSVHRVIASCFLKNPNNYPQVNHKDCNPSNNTVSNLEWCTASYNCQYREKYGVSGTESHGRSLFGVNLETGKKHRFRSRAEAGRFVGISAPTIWSVIQGRQKTAGGYWFTEEESKITKEKLRKIKDGMRLGGGVFAVNLKTLEILYFLSQSKAAHSLKIGVPHINAVLRNKRNHTGGYWFTYANENAVEATRSKFDDEIANKVADLMNEKESQTA